MKLVRKSQDGSTAELKLAETAQKSSPAFPPWKVLIVDDEVDVHTMTELGLKNFEFQERPLKMLHAHSGAEAREILKAEPDIAIALVDVVMETDDAGLRLINFIRDELHYRLIRLIIRTGQPGMAPEREVIERYDIDDYKSKTELRADKLYLMIRVALKSYRELLTLDSNRKALRKILEAVPKFHHAQSLTQFFNGVLGQLIGLCNLGENSLIYSVNSGLVITADTQQHEAVVQSGTGRFAINSASEEIEKVRHVCSARLLGESYPDTLPPDALLIPLEIHHTPVGFVYLENALKLSPADRDLIQIMAQQCSSALENLQLYTDLKAANEKTLKLLEVTEQAREEAEIARREAEIASKAKSQFLANMSHELRTPLNAIIGYSELVEDVVTEAQLTECIADLLKIRDSGKHLLHLVDEVLDFSKIETGNTEILFDEFPLQPMLDELVELMKPLIEQKHNRFQFIDSPQITAIHTDWTKLRKILLILLSNAAKFTENGTVCLEVTVIEQSVIFQVTDSGIGMTPEQQLQLFQPFSQGDSSFTRRYGGAGLGLAIAHRLAQILGGELTCRSGLQQGSTFELHLPII
jgi:signal transduction histidine kinase